MTREDFRDFLGKFLDEDITGLVLDELDKAEDYLSSIGMVLPDELDLAINEAARSIRVFPGKNGETTVDTSYLVDDLVSVIRRFELIRDGAWMHGGLDTAIGSGDLAGLVRQLAAVTRKVAPLSRKR